jgi:hypothetical protein
MNKHFAKGTLVGLMLIVNNAQAQISPQVGDYENRSESYFVYKLSLKKDGKARYFEPDAETGKNVVHNGIWSSQGESVTVDFGRKGKYVFEVKDKLSWASFGCKGGTPGLKSISTPRGKGDVTHDVWRSVDLKRADRCQRV